MNTEMMTIATVNQVAILATSNDELIPIRPICDALGIDSKSQRDKIQSRELFSKVAVLSPSSGADGKEYEMLCLPTGYALGWLCTINPANVKEEARAALMMYQKECFLVLYEHFVAKTRFLEEKQREIDRQQEVVDTLKSEYSSVKSQLSEAENRLKKLRSMTMDDYDMERKQLKINF